MKIRKVLFCLVPQTRTRHFFFGAQNQRSPELHSMSEHFLLHCRECHREYSNRPTSICENCLAPLEVKYDMEAARKTFTRENITARPNNLWRYAELLPLPEGYQPDLPVGMTPLV